ncbi:NADH-quinone oxidoreductase subunit L [wastewater metagenome]|uniref:NADH-quinone oxidoreductase subunit L n=2 Tax=unclassified sequences TaxID=12908 RepID=A0A5B8R645_9ZZZZ|nr:MULTISPECIES: NADH-quinone oxidoreductase subunit L [Arhodomonas]MCS4504667.1 NADH-quinone oxidoreductase subunit L [Arhodomonas aquaeolei]QEA04066.1 NADH-quinone oxidoreductase subunit L [uncultured organism]
METVYLLIVLAPLIGAAVTGLYGRRLGRVGAHRVAIGAVAISCALSFVTLFGQLSGAAEPFNGAVYTWAAIQGLTVEVGFLVDRLTAMMMVVVTFVSLMVHIYTIGYMADDEHNWPAGSGAGVASYQRFFSYINLFTFSMLMLVMANNFMQLFFGWEGVGLVSYLLIGFWLNRPSATFANLKAFLVNRVGDFGFVLGIATVFMYYGSLDYAQVFGTAAQSTGETMTLFGGEALVATVACILLLIGAMAKSAQVPLHVWLPDSMEGPTPISALIHAATMVTAGIFMIARMSPLYEQSVTALSVILVIGGITAFFMGLVGLVQDDIKRVIAYSTLSQLGYMFVALGASAYAAGVFHLMTHAFFKALLFLGAGSVIIAMHHKQDMREMGGLRKYMPVTYWTMLVGTLALIGTPFFSGYYSKDAIIEAVHLAATEGRPGAEFAYWCVLLGVFVTALYSFRLFFLVFHGKERMDAHTREHLHESPRVVTVPLILLAIPSVVIGWFTTGPVLYGDYFGGAIHVAEAHDVLHHMAEEVWHGPVSFGVHALVNPAFWLTVAGVAVTWVLYIARPGLLPGVRRAFGPVGGILERKYGFDALWINGFAGLGRGIGRVLWRGGDAGLIDGVLINGTARTIGRVAALVRGAQSGYLYHYAFAMIIGLLILLTWLVGGWQGWFA